MPNKWNVWQVNSVVNLAVVWCIAVKKPVIEQIPHRSVAQSAAITQLQQIVTQQ